jgi:putative restriction endonuclease
MAPKNTLSLLDHLVSAIQYCGWQPFILEKRNPFLIQASDGTGQSMTLRIYIWNCTHGGGHRAADEYRVQLTKIPEEVSSGERLIVLGWHDAYKVFVAFDPKRHIAQAGESPSAQVKESALEEANRNMFAAHVNTKGETIIAMRPSFFMTYVANAVQLHKFGKSAELSALNEIAEKRGKTDADQSTEITGKERKEVLRTVKHKVRDADFRDRILAAYRSTCAMCGMQLRLIDAAHIVPVDSPKSTDNTNNGIALCALHHRAFDNGLVSFDLKYRIELNQTNLRKLEALDLAGGYESFKNSLRAVIDVPADLRDHPHPQHIKQGRTLRGWD